MIITVVGNYPKISAKAGAPNLRRAISQFDTGRITQEELDRVAGQVTQEVIQEQVEAGVDLITDGQVRWNDGQTYVARGIKGFQINGLTRYFDTNTYYRQPVPEEKLEWKGPITVGDFKFATEISPRPVKPVITGPYTLGRLSQLGSYGELHALVMDLAHGLNKESLALQEAGATLIQFDEPAILRYPEEMDLLVEASQVLTQGVRVKTAIYTWFGGIPAIGSRFFSLPFDVFGLDFVMGPENYEMIQHLPPEKELAVGIMDARNTRMESVDVLVDSIRRISRYVPLDRLYVNPSAGLEYLPRITAQEKLARLVEGVRKAQEVLV